ncbi:hypothetical protein MMC25_000244, partial [Agyrium rufum]|nr:hypothetical protein [Agyrium rufum]
GVRNVVVGGKPANGPMQTPGGTRGAAYYTDIELNNDFANVEGANASTANLLPTPLEIRVSLSSGS